MKLTLPNMFCLLAVSAAALAASARVQAADKMMDSSMDKTFVKKAAIGGMFEVESGKLAQDMGTAQSVKDFGAKMVEDHGKANEELKSIASSKSLEIPGALDSAHMKMVDDLKGKSGKDFDSLYLKDMSKAHKMDDALFTKEAKSGTDADLKAFAAKTDVVIKQHISMLGDTMKSMK